jgi:hypothetical protein
MLLTQYIRGTTIDGTQVQEGAEKEAAFRGLLALLAFNLEAAFTAFTSLCSCVASWTRAPAALERDLAALMLSLKAKLEPLGQWDAALARIDSETYSPRVRTRIQQFVTAPAM